MFNSMLLLKNSSSGGGGNNYTYRGKDLTSTYTIEQLSTKIQTGNIKDLYIGDYITKSITVNGTTTTQNFRIAAFNWFLGHGDTPLATNHLLMIPDGSLCESYMNSGRTSTGYALSYMYTTTMPLVTTGLQNCFGSNHILPYRSLLSNSINRSEGTSASYAWYTSYCNLCSTVQVYNSDDEYYDDWKGITYDQGDGTTQLPLFKLNSSLKIITSTNWWLSTVTAISTTYTCFVLANNSGYPDGCNGSASFAVRPLFLFS